MSGTTSEAEPHLGTRLSSKMLLAGFKASNATVQCAMAAVLEDLGRLLLGYDNLYAFGSFSEGWGSCLIRIDGSVESESDIDVTIIYERNMIHLCNIGGASGSSRCPCNGTHTGVNYDDGHVICAIESTTPNLPIHRAPLLAALDVIVARRCCCYPKIAILEPEYNSHMSPTVLQLLKSEIDNPRCHAVSASPPGREGTCMRVSTTHLERIVMRNLTTIQGQFFVIIKYLVKKVINKRVSGLKTYVAKNLLFYMLDTTPEKEWISTNLMSLVRESLQLLATMIESSVGDDVCMTHFFLQDANVYLKKEHHPKTMILTIIQQTLTKLPDLLTKFEEGLNCSEHGNAVHFHCFWLLLFSAELLAANPGQFSTANYEVLNDGHKMLRDDSPHVATREFENLIDRVKALPDCVKVSRECILAMLHLRAGRPLCPEEFSPICKGIRTDDSHRGRVTFDEARQQVIQILQDVQVMGIQVSDDRSIRGCALQLGLSGMASILQRSSSGESLNGLEIGLALVFPTQLFSRFLSIMPDGVEQLQDFVTHLSSISNRFL